MISNEKKKILHVAQRSLGLSRDAYEAVLHGAAGVTSSNELDLAGFERAMRRFEELGFVNTARQRYLTPRPEATPNPEHLAKIRALFGELGWTETERQQGFCKRQCGKPWPQTRRDANKVIEGLKAMVKRETAKRNA